MSNVPVSVHIDQPIEKVFDYLTTASNWMQWHPSTAAVFGAIYHPAIKGEKITEKVRMGFTHERFNWTVTECDRPYRWAISAVSDMGVKVDIAYTLTAEGEGTAWLREMDFHIPKLYWLADKLLFRHFVRWNSSVAVRQLKDIMESY